MMTTALQQNQMSGAWRTALLLWLLAATGSSFLPYARILLQGQAFSLRMADGYPAQALLTLCWLLAAAQWWAIKRKKPNRLFVAWGVLALLQWCHVASIYRSVSPLFVAGLRPSLAQKMQATANFQVGFYVYVAVAIGSVLLTLMFFKSHAGVPAKTAAP